MRLKFGVRQIWDIGEKNYFFVIAYRVFVFVCCGFNVFFLLWVSCFFRKLRRRKFFKELEGICGFFAQRRYCRFKRNFDLCGKLDILFLLNWEKIFGKKIGLFVCLLTRYLFC